MTWNEGFQIISGVIVSVGGAAAIILGLASYLGKIWAKRYLESIKNEYKKEIESYKAALSLFKETTLRYSGQQFELYNQLWTSLCNLKSSADLLWSDTTRPNLVNFSKQLKSTIDEVEKSYLFIEEKHYTELSKLLNEFENYELGKRKLIQFQSAMTNEALEHLFNHSDANEPTERQQHLERSIKLLTEHNMERKRRYEKLIKTIGSDLKKQLSGRE